MIKHIEGNILDSPEDQIIIQQVNCANAMGKGVAKAIYEKYPFVKEQYHQCCNGTFLSKHGPKKKPEELLGDVFMARAEGYQRRVLNIFGQLSFWKYGSKKTCLTDYKAFQKALDEIATYFAGCHVTFAVPYGIGCGLAGGDWAVVSNMIDSTLGQAFDVIYYKI